MRRRPLRTTHPITYALALALLVGGCASDSDAPSALKFPARVYITNLDPNAPGYFLRGVAPSTCFQDKYPDVIDGDSDWLDDNCEYQLAWAFRPYLQFTLGEDCPGREPAWAAKYFNTLGVVRIAYMPAYYQDCGVIDPLNFSAHNGDAELILVDIVFNTATNHWEFDRMWTSAHSGTSNNHSAWNYAEPDSRDEPDGVNWHFPVTFPDRNRGAPKVFVSRDKHANYFSADICGDQDGDVCIPFGDLVRHEVEWARNAGSRFVDRMGCVYARLEPLASSGRCEGFYYDNGKFYGWWDPQFGGGATSYRSQLLESFEYYYVGGKLLPGPGPYPPGTTQSNNWANVYGPTEAGLSQTCYFYAQTDVGDPQVEWRVNETTVGTGRELYYASGSSYILELVVWNSSGAGANDSHSVTVGSGHSCEAM